ncbi:SdrD B-like domain-containing protein [Acinetobacter sp. VNK23]|uniref:beta strand repeat-containing protein n=1 Tax=Acinetobacter thutiue TaxID=2998078 RepID=UPI0025752F73|nr:SdrD B-like domain-containing protein [Acinetobacter thutiue]MDM1019326.1 SdrD B-like domain-containing protein [Acinetobacter thutiue]
MIKWVNHAVLKLLILFFSLVGSISVAQAAYQRSYLNFDFESNTLGPACYVQLDASSVPGWNTTHKNQKGSGSCSNPSSQTGKLIELWSDKFGGYPARQGNVFAELNAEEYSEMQQNVCLIQGEPVSWKLSHNGRDATDRMSLRAGAQTIVSVATSKNGDGSILSCASGSCNVSSGVVTYNGNKFWADYSGTFNYTGTTGPTVLGFKADTGSSGSLGNFLDAIQISVKPIIEFASASYEIPENGIPQDIKVIVVGIIPAGGLTLTFNVNDGIPPKNAEINLDYKINGSINKTFTKTIPAGDYGMGTPYTISIPVEIIDDKVAEPDEQFTVTIQRDDNNFYLYSSSVCGSSGNGTTTYTIIDDDAPTQMNVAISKSQKTGSGAFSSDPLTVSTSTTMQYQLVMTNLGENPIDPTALATFTDTLPSNLTNLSIASQTASSGATCQASRSGNVVSGTFSGPKNSTCTVIIQATTPSTGAILTNTATASVPVGNVNNPNTDIDPSNNSSTVQTTVAAATLILNKATTSGIGTFGYSLTNTLQSSASVTIDMPGDPVQVDSDTTKSGIQPFIISSINSNVVITETMPTGQTWELSTPVCKNAAGNTVTPTLSGNTITIGSSNIVAGAVITCNLMNTRLPTVKVQKISYGGTGTFSFTKTNLTGTLNNITTSTTGIAAPTNPTALPVTAKGTDVTITEGTPPNNYVLTEASCRDDNSNITGNTGTFGNLVNSTRVLTIPLTYLITGGADITCTFVNRLNPQTDLTITKTNDETSLLRGQATSYLVRVTNNGSIPVMGATLTDAAGTNQTKASVACSGAGNNQCTANSTPTITQIQSGYTLPRLDSGQFYEVIVNATVGTATSVTSTDNTATVTPPTGVTNTGASCTTMSANPTGITRSFTVGTGICSVKDTDTVTASSRALTIQKTWVNAKQFDKATITADTTTGLVTLESIATGVASQTDSSSILVANSTNVTLKEVIDVGDGNYTVTGPTCTAGTVSNNNNGTYNLALPSSNTTAITCTYTNTRKTATLKLTKTWTNAKTGDVVAIPATLGLSTNTTKFKSTAPAQADSNTITVYVGDTVTFSAEIGLGDYASGDPNYDATVTMNKDNYNANLSCTANGGATANLLSGTNAKQGNTLTIGAADTGKLITCIYNNSRIPQQIKLIKEWKNATLNDQIKVVTTGGTGNPGVISISSGNNTDEGGVVTVYSGDVLTLPTETFVNGIASQYTVTTGCNGGSPLTDGVVNRTITISNNTMTTVCTYTNTRTVAQTIIFGRVFNDNSGTTGDVSKAYNGVQDTGESGIANNTVRLTNCSSTTLATTSTDANGDYKFNIDQDQLPISFCIVQTNLSEYTSVSGVSPTGMYSRNTDTITVPKTTATSYPNNNFADVKLNVLLTEDGQHTITAGEVTDYPHRLSTQAPVWVTQLEQAQSNSNNDQPWQALVYRDSDCNGTVDAGETVFNPSNLLLQPNADICLVQRVFAPTNIFAGAQHIGKLQASYAVAALSLTNQKTQQRQDVTLIGITGLTLIKKVRTVSSCTSTPSDSLGFKVNNTAQKQESLEYEITYKNNSVKNIKNVRVKDSLPMSTNLNTISCQMTPSGNTCAASQTGDVLEWALTGLLQPSATGTLRFCVSQ